jgi:hypothetical protein
MPHPTAFGIEPDDALDPLADLADGPRLGIVVVVRASPRTSTVVFRSSDSMSVRTKAAEGIAEVRAAVIVHRRALERPSRWRGPTGWELKAWVTSAISGHEDVGAHAREALLQAPHELEHEARGVAHGVGDVAQGDQLGLLPVDAGAKRSSMGTPPYWRLLRMVRRESSRPLLLLALAHGEGVLDLAREPRHHRLHLATSSGRGRRALVREDLPAELLPLAVGAALELALDVLADHAPEGLERRSR